MPAHHTFRSPVTEFPCWLVFAIAGFVYNAVRRASRYLVQLWADLVHPRNLSRVDTLAQQAMAGLCAFIAINGLILLVL